MGEKVNLFRAQAQLHKLTFSLMIYLLRIM